jgi:glycerophosphoryl diester phosphodiesterase
MHAMQNAGMTTKRYALARPLLQALLALALCAPALAFDLQSHRGTRGHMPENTLPAFERGMAIGVTTLELDIGITADGVAVIHHDRALNPNTTRDAKGQWLDSTGPLIRSLTLEQLQIYDVGRLKPGTSYAQEFARQQAVDGTRVPTLAALFKRAGELGANDMQFDMETKIDPRSPNDTLAPEAFVKTLLAVIREYGMESRVQIQSFDWRTLVLVQAQEPRIRTVYLSTKNSLASGAWTAGFTLAQYSSAPRMVKAAGGPIWSPNYNDLTAELLKEAQSLGLKVIPWTANEPADIDRLIAMGVDGIISDYADRVREIMQKRGIPLPAKVEVPGVKP